MSKAIEIANDELKLNALESLMWEASDAIIDVYHQDDFGTETKGDSSPVTMADLAAHNVLVAGLKNNYALYSGCERGRC